MSRQDLMCREPHPELAIGAFPPCSVFCWEKSRGSMARCECYRGFQGEVAGGCQAALLLIAGSVEGISEQGTAVATTPAISHLGSDAILSRGCVSYPADVRHPHPSRTSHSALPLPCWASPLCGSLLTLLIVRLFPPTIPHILGSPPPSAWTDPSAGLPPPPTRTPNFAGST